MNAPAPYAPADRPDVRITDQVSIGNGQPVFVIAEIGQNHNGSMETAKKLIDVAAKCGVTAIKSCKRDLKSELTQEAWDRPYVGPQSFGPTYGEHRMVLELSPEQHQELSDHSNQKGLIYFVSACDVPSVDVMEGIGVPLYKVASRDLTNIPLLERMAETGKPIILSAGMGGEEDLQDAFDVIRAHHDNIVLLQCTSEYPTPYPDVNLNAMQTLRERFDVLVGLSDHTIGIMTAVAGVAMGAVAVEKHLTLARHMKGTDHAASLEPAGMEKVVRDIQNLRQAFGDGSLSVPEGVQVAEAKLRRSLTSGCRIAEGTMLAEEHLVLKSPGTGLKWRERAQLLGKRATRDIEADQTLRPEDFS